MQHLQLLPQEQENAGARGNAAGLGGKRLKLADVPPSMTVEQFLNDERDRLMAEVQSYAGSLSEALRREYATLKSEFLERARAKAAEAAAGEEEDEGEGEEASSTGPHGTPVAAKAGEAAAAELLPPPPQQQQSLSGKVVLELSASDGAYKDKSYLLALEAGRPVLVGRSRAKTIGLSLPKDKEVSTTHGRFEVAADQVSVCYVDVGSTNGSWCNGHELARNVPCALKAGDVIKVGTNMLKVVSVSGRTAP
jgi:hypothetical protein